MPDGSMMENPATKRVTRWLKNFDKALETNQIDKAVGMFGAECYWRDLVSFTWNICTQESKDDIKAMLKSVNKRVKPGAWAIEGEATETDGTTEAWFTFETKTARGRGHIRLKGSKCWTLLTTMVELKGHEEPKGPTRAEGVKHGKKKDALTYKEQREKEDAELGYKEQPYCVIIGGGQGGIAMGARLRRLGVPTIIIEKNERPGDSWRKRYKSLALHDPVWYDHLPYLPFPDHWPVFSPKDKIGDWLESYTKIMELNYWGNTECKSASFDEKTGEWTVKVIRDGKRVTLKPKQLVLATGMSAVPNIPNFKGQDKFKGEQQHSSQHPGPDKYKGKKVVVIGSNNSSHDICAALYEGEADVTMIQRSSTHIAKSETLMKLALGGLYSEEAMAAGIDHHMADLIFASVPYKIMHGFHIPVYEEMARVDKRLYDKLRKAGFMLDFGEDGSGLFMKYLRRGSGYYIDVGASEMVADGRIKLKSGVSVKELTKDSVVFDDGTSLKADLIVYATGYGSMNGWAAQLISKKVADKVGKCWGLGSDTTKDPGPWEGELRNMWKPTRQEALWFHGGNLHQSRHYSQFLSLQIKARHAGIKTPVYGLAGVHHKS